MRIFFKFLYALGEQTQRGARYGDPVYVGSLYATIVMWPALYGALQFAAKMAGPFARDRLDELVFGKAPLGYLISGVLAIAISDWFLMRNRTRINAEFGWIPIVPSWRVRLQVTLACMLLAGVLTAVAVYFPMASIPVSITVFGIGSVVIRRWRERTTTNRNP